MALDITIKDSNGGILAHVALDREMHSVLYKFLGDDYPSLSLMRDYYGEPWTIAPAEVSYVIDEIREWMNPFESIWLGPQDWFVRDVLIASLKSFEELIESYPVSLKTAAVLQDREDLRQRREALLRGASVRDDPFVRRLLQFFRDLEALCRVALKEGRAIEGDPD